MYQISNSISSSFESRDKNRHEASTVLFHSRMKKSNEKRELRDRGKKKKSNEKVKDPYIVSCETTTSGPVSNYRRGVDSTVRFSRRDKEGEGGGGPAFERKKGEDPRRGRVPHGAPHRNHLLSVPSPRHFP